MTTDGDYEFEPEEIESDPDNKLFIEYVTAELKSKDEIEFWKDEFDIEIIPEKVEVLEIVEMNDGIRETHAKFRARLNDGDPILIEFDGWSYPATRYEPDDSGSEMSPILGDDKL
jgi:hypothetical protein